MDQLFAQAERWIKNSTTKKGVSLDLLYDGLDTQGEKRMVVIGRLCDMLLEVQQLANSTKLPNGMIAISLQDMKTFNMMANILVIEGIYACLSPGMNIPLQQRARNVTEVVPDPVGNRPLLIKIVDSLITLLSTKGDVRDMLLRGTFTADFLCATMELGFDSEFEHREPGKFEAIKKEIQTYDLYQYFATLLRPSAPQWCRALLSRQLAMLPVSRPNGVRALIEFTSGLRTHEQISLTDLDRAVRILKSIPSGMKEDDYAKKIGSQLITILGRTVVAAQNPGAADTLKSATLHIINSLYEQKPEIVEVGIQQQLISRMTRVQTESALNENLGCLATLTLNPSDVLNLLRTSLVVPIWSLLCFYKQQGRKSEQVMGLLVALVRGGGTALADQITKSLLINGVGEYNYAEAINGGVELKKLRTVDSTETDVFAEIDQRVDLFVSLLQDLDESVVSGLFVRLLRRWLTAGDREDIFGALTDVKILQEVSQKYKDKLMKSPSEIIEVIASVLSRYTVKLEDKNTTSKGSQRLDSIVDDEPEGDSDDEDSDDEDDETSDSIEMVSMCLSLAGGLASEMHGRDLDLMSALRPQIEYIANHSMAGDLSTKALNALEFLRVPTGKTEGGEDSSKAVLRKALVALEDPMVPIRAYGLHQIRTLIQANDPVIDVHTGLRILLNQLQDEDSFIYLNSIKALESLSDKQGPAKVVPELIKHYRDESVDKDQRLRCGEVLIRVVQRLDAAFVGNVADIIVNNMIEMVSLRNGKIDETLRNSALSILGATCEANPRGLTTTQLNDSLDCAIGVLTFEQSTVMRSAAIVLIGSLIKGVDNLNQVPKQYVSQIMTRLRTAEDDADSLVRVQAQATLQRIRQKLVDQM